MALRPDRHIVDQDAHSWTLSDVASKGVGLCFSTAGSGAVIGDSRGVVTLAADPSGSKFAGILLADFVDKDMTQTHLDWHKEEQLIGDVAPVLRKGWVWTDKLVSGQTPTVGDTAYLGASGAFRSVSLGDVATPVAGVFGGKKDEDGFVKIEINLPFALS